MKRRLPLLLSLIALLGSLLINLLLYRETRKWYRWFNMTRLDPLGAGHFVEENSVEDDKPLVVFFGDSRARAWPNPEIDNVAFANRGIDGHTSAQSLLRFESHVVPLEPDVIILQVGVNDLVGLPLMPGREEEIVHNTIANIEQTVTRSRELGAHVVLTTVFPSGQIPLYRRPFWSDAVPEAIDVVNDTIRKLEADGVTVFETELVLADQQGRVRPEYAADELHLNPAGYAALNEALRPLLVGLTTVE